jgi:DtxR family Mn-dependent transcriptional regulator
MAMSSRHTDSHAVEEYLEAIHRFEGTDRGVSTSGLAEHLGVRPASVTGMLKRLAEMGLISYQRYGDIALTAEGSRRAHALVRRHRIAERLLADVLKMPLDQVHDEACHLEHGVSAQLEAHLVQVLGSPRSCPHGHPIDAAEDDQTLPLTQASLGRPLTIARLDDESPQVVRYLSERGLLPGAQVTLRKWESFGDVLVLEAGGAAHNLSASLAHSIRVKRK